MGAPHHLHLIAADNIQVSDSANRRRERAPSLAIVGIRAQREHSTSVISRLHDDLNGASVLMFSAESWDRLSSIPVAVNGSRLYSPSPVDAALSF